jgi:hypothetical protein
MNSRSNPPVEQYAHRKALMDVAPVCFQRMPVRFIRCCKTWLMALSTTPLPM